MTAGLSVPKDDTIARTRRNRVAMILAAIVAGFALYELITRFVAYTDDAFVDSYLVAVAPEVTGRVVNVHVTDNELVKAGELLIEIDPVPFQLIVDQRQAQVEEAKALLLVDRDTLNKAEDQVKAAVSTLALARVTQQRAASLRTSGYGSQASLDKANDAWNQAVADSASAQSAADAAKATIAWHEAGLQRAEADMGTARWNLARTKVVAPVDGAINNLTVRVGDMANKDRPMIGIVDAAGWRIIANYKQDYIRNFKIGGEAWIWLDSERWHLHRARITGIARGISRNPASDKLLPYVAPTTDWIRLQRRFPVTLTLVDPPPSLVLFMGADARVVIFP